MNEYDVYKTWLAMHVHFSQPEYDFIAYKGATSANYESLVKANEYKIYLAIKTKFKNRVELVETVLAYMNHKRAFTVPSITVLINFKINRQEVVQNWRKRVSSLEFYINKDIEEICETDYTGKELILPNQIDASSPPALLRMWENRVISTDTMFVLNQQFNLFKIWDAKIKPDIVWRLQSFYINKYCRFVNFDDKDFSKSLNLFRRNKLNLQEANQINF